MFQRKVGEIIEGLEGCKNNQDDIIIWGRSKVEHDKRLNAVLDRIQAANLKFNREQEILRTLYLTRHCTG